MLKRSETSLYEPYMEVDELDVKADGEYIHSGLQAEQDHPGDASHAIFAHQGVGHCLNEHENAADAER